MCIRDRPRVFWNICTKLFYNSNIECKYYTTTNGIGWECDQKKTKHEIQYMAGVYFRHELMDKQNLLIHYSRSSFFFLAVLYSIFIDLETDPKLLPWERSPYSNYVILQYFFKSITRPHIMYKNEKKVNFAPWDHCEIRYLHFFSIS